MNLMSMIVLRASRSGRPGQQTEESLQSPGAGQSQFDLSSLTHPRVSSRTSVKGAQPLFGSRTEAFPGSSSQEVSPEQDPSLSTGRELPPCPDLFSSVFGNTCRDQQQSYFIVIKKATQFPAELGAPFHIFSWVTPLLGGSPVFASTFFV